MGGLGGTTGCRLGVRHRLAGNPSGRPSGLEVVAPRDSVDIESFACEVEARDDPTFHGFCVDLLEGDSPTGNELLLIHALSGDLKLCGSEDLDEAGGRFTAEFRPTIFGGNSCQKSQLFPKPTWEWGPFRAKNHLGSDRFPAVLDFTENLVGR